MNKIGILVATALLAASASPSMAQEVIYNPGYCAQFYPNANCQNKGPGNPYTGYGYYGDRAWQGSYNGPSYAERNGFVCTPGTWFRGADGRPHPCQ